MAQSGLSADYADYADLTITKSPNRSSDHNDLNCRRARFSNHDQTVLGSCQRPSCGPNCADTRRFEAWPDLYEDHTMEFRHVYDGGLPTVCATGLAMGRPRLPVLGSAS
jgi:hypothetical protein